MAAIQNSDTHKNDNDNLDVMKTYRCFLMFSRVIEVFSDMK